MRRFIVPCERGAVSLVIAIESMVVAAFIGAVCSLIINLPHVLPSWYPQ